MDLIFTLENIDGAAGQIIEYLCLQKQRVVTLYGPMGAGKTTLTSAILRKLGSADVASSPTFSIINQYLDANGDPVFHMDWYRLRDEEEAISVGVEDPLFSGHWCFVEWPEKAEGLLPNTTIKLKLEALDENTRKVTLEP
jgi:tRNA threonylcarbamoyladenosine biosynthesis protein TsaE